MTSYLFSVIIDISPQEETEILDIADTLGSADCLDASVCGHPEGVEAVFDRDASSLQEAIHSAVTAIEGAGFQVKRVELERQHIVAKTYTLWPLSRLGLRQFHVTVISKASPAILETATDLTG